LYFQDIVGEWGQSTFTFTCESGVNGVEKCFNGVYRGTKGRCGISIGDGVFFPSKVANVQHLDQELNLLGS